MSSPETAPKNWLGFSYICSEYYELDLNIGETELKRKLGHTSNNKVKLFCENIVVVEEEWFYDMNLTNIATFLTDLIKH